MSRPIRRPGPYSGHLTPISIHPPTQFVITLSDPDAHDAHAARSLENNNATDEIREEKTTITTTSTPLSESDVSALLARVPEVKSETNDQTEFHQREKSLAAPKTGEIVNIPFPPEEKERAQMPDLDEKSLAELSREESGPLSVTRSTPNGSIDHAVTSVSITFNQGMIAISSVDEVKQQMASLPITITPTPSSPAEWRWHGVNTVTYTPEHRLNYATTYTVRVAAGIASVTGSKLEQDHIFTFTTRPPQVVQAYPNGNVIDHLDPTCIILFNQRIDPNVIFKHFKVTYPGRILNTTLSGKDLVMMDHHACRDLPDDTRHSHIRSIVTNSSNDGQWIVFRFAKTLTKATTYTVSLDTIISAEGPNTGPSWSTSFSTYEPLRITSHHPQDKKDYKGNPGTAWSIQFNNALDHSTVRKEMFVITPAVEGLGIEHNGSNSYLTLYNNSLPNTTYTCTIQPGLHDIFGQHLDGNNVVKFGIGPAIKENIYGSVTGGGNMIVMDPAVSAAPYYPIMVYNYSHLHVKVYQVQPSDYSAAQSILNYWGYTQNNHQPPGKCVYDKEIETKAIKNDPTPMNIDLSQHLQDRTRGVGQLLVIVEPTQNAWKKCQGSNGQEYKYRDIAAAWIQCTHLSVDVFTSDKSRPSMTAWITELATGKPIAGAKIVDSITNEHGLVTFDALPGTQSITVSYGTDITFLPNVYTDIRNYNQSIWYVVDDRQLYKPKEKVHIKGYLRKLETHGEARIPRYETGFIKYIVNDPRGAKLHEGKIPLSSFGTFNFAFDLPDNVNLGNGSISFEHILTKDETSAASSYHHTFKIQEFRRPEYEISSSHTPTTNHYTDPNNGGFAIAEVKASLFAGGPLSEANVQWTVTPRTTSYTPAGWSHFTFGTHQWGWMSYGREEQTLGSYSHSGVTGGDGRHEVRVEWKGVDDEPKTIRVTAQAQVRDLNQQTQETATSWVVHPCRHYVGLSIKNSYGKKETPMDLETVVVDVDGKVVEGVTIKVTIHGTGTEKKEDEQGLTVFRTIEDIQTVDLISTLAPIKHTFTPNLGGSYKIVAEIFDSQGGHYRSTYPNLYIGGGYEPRQTAKVERIPTESIQIIPNKNEYSPGDIAELMLISPFSPAEGLALLQCEGLVSTPIRFTIPADVASTTISFPISQDWIPGLTCMVEMVGSVPRGDDDTKEHKQESQPPRPAIAKGSLKMTVSRQSRSLDVQVTSHRSGEEVGPGKTIHVHVNVKNSATKQAPQATEVTLIMVDESVLSLTGYSLSSPLELFYPNRNPGSNAYHHRQSVLLINAADVARLRREMEERRAQEVQKEEESMQMKPRMMMMKKSAAPMAAFGGAARMMMPAPPPAPCAAPMMSMMAMDMAAGGAQQPQDNTPIAVRSNFDALAAFFPDGVTDADGNVEFEVKLPDSLTRYRIWALTSNALEYGLGESLLIVQLPLMIRPSPPRFLNYGDTAAISVILQNQTDRELHVHVATRATNASLTGAKGYQLTLAPAKRSVVTFPVQSQSAGTARFQFVVSAPGFADAAEVSFPVFTPSTSEAFATYGDIAEKTVVFQPIKAPSNVIPQFGGLDISTSTTQLQALTDAFIYLVDYPYDCCEQIASRIIGIASLWAVLKAFQVKEMPTEAKLRKHLDTDLQVLRGRQYHDGGYGWWTVVHGYSEPFISVHVALSLVILRPKDLASIPSTLLERSIAYCRDIKSRVASHRYARDWHESTKNAIYAFAYYVLALHEVDDAASLASSLVGNKDLSFESLGFILIALSRKREKYAKEIKQIMTHIQNNVTETADTAHFITSYGDDGASVMLHSNRRTDAVLLSALLTLEPKNTLVPKLAKGLLAHRVRGRWSNTQENCFILIALRHYFDVYEKDEPDFNIHTWLGENYCGQQVFKGRSVDTNKLSIPMTTVLSEPTQNLIIQKQGPGRLYYRLGLNYAPSDLNLKPLNYGFKVTRAYAGVDSPSHVTQTGPNSYRFALGEKIKVTLTMTTPMRRYHVALVDWMPAGIEALNPALKGTISGASESSVSRSEGYNPWRCRWFNRYSWPEHENLRDERAEAFRSLLWEGVYEWSYIARATTSGEFVAPPAKAEEMYAPENFGRSGTDRVVIE